MNTNEKIWFHWINQRLTWNKNKHKLLPEERWELFENQKEKWLKWILVFEKWLNLKKYSLDYQNLKRIIVKTFILRLLMLFYTVLLNP